MEVYDVGATNKWNVNELIFDEKGLIPVIAQDYESGEVLMLG